MKDKFSLEGFGSVAVHGGHIPDETGAHLVPIYSSSTYVFESAEQGMRRFNGDEQGYIYARWGNPTVAEAEQKLAALEGFGLNIKLKGFLHASGMAAITTLMLANLKTGDKVLTHYSLYGGTEELLHKVLPPLGITGVVADLRSTEGVEEMIAADPQIKMLYLETPANPTMQCVDIEALTVIAKEHDKIVACDNTFATPYLQQPFKYGVDFVVHSTTKFLNGHGTAIGGALIARQSDFAEVALTKTFRLLGGTASPFDAFLLINGMKTLELRMQRHCSNAAAVAQWLEGQQQVEKVNYPGLTSHPQHSIATRQMRLPGAMVSFELKSGLEGGKRFMNALQMCLRTVSLGTCDTLLCHPASMTHYGVGREERLRYGITDGLMRMNVGIENVEDIIADLKQAMAMC